MSVVKGYLTKSPSPRASRPGDQRVRPGDTLAMLAVRFQVSAATVRSANNLKTDELKVGQVWTIPGTELAAQ